MIRHLARLLLLTTCLAPSGCATDVTTASSSHAIIDTPCATDADCPGGFRCSSENEHGTNATVCESEDTSGTCPPGYEAEDEHGQVICQPHGGNGSGSGSGSGSGTLACATDADCPAGDQCELEIEHGTTTGTCTPHS